MFAIKLEKAFEISAELWVTMQAKCQKKSCLIFLGS
jgi:plasmid maintenance system antidote protein VapI